MVPSLVLSELVRQAAGVRIPQICGGCGGLLRAAACVELHAGLVVGETGGGGPCEAAVSAV
jgi:hypothetical protein